MMQCLVNVQFVARRQPVILSVFYVKPTKRVCPKESRLGSGLIWRLLGPVFLVWRQPSLVSALGTLVVALI